MGWKYDEDLYSDMFVFSCDWQGCAATAKSAIVDGSPRYSMPEDWSGILMTSMSDGDYFGVLCPDHGGAIKDAIGERMRDCTALAVGY